jgi:pimeloyl-ACP methyl ester carboxylesterase
MYGTDIISGDVIALIDLLGLDRVSIVGYSIGSTIALHLMHTYASRFDAGALVATGDGLIGYPPLTFPAILPHLADTLRRTEFPEDLPAHQAAYWTLATQIAGDRAAVAAGAEGDYPPCTPEEAGSIDAPVLVVSADKDLVLGTGARLAASLKRGRYMEISGADHFSLALDETVQIAVTDFFAGSR